MKKQTQNPKKSPPLFENLKNKFNSLNLQKLGINFIIATFLLWVIMFLIREDLPSWLGDKFFFVLFIASGVFYFVQKIKSPRDDSGEPKIPEIKRDSPRDDSGEPKSSIVYYFSHLFLLSLLVIAINQFLKRAWITNNLFYISVLSIGFGFLTFYANRDRVEKEIEDEKVSEEEAEKKRIEEFDVKFPRIARIWGLRNIVKWMYKEGWWYSVGLIAIVVFVILIYASNLGGQYFWTDEAISYKVSSLILEKGAPIFDNGAEYYGSPTYHYLLAFSMKIFGTGEFSSRIINLFSLGGIMILLYFILKKQNKRIALLSIILYGFMNLNLTMVRETRMYSLFTLIFLLIIIYFLQIYKDFKNKGVSIKLIIKILLFLLLFYAGYHTHGFIAMFVFAIPIFFIINFIKNKSKKDLMLFILSSSLISIYVFIKYQTLNIIKVLSTETAAEWAQANALNPTYYLKILQLNFPLFFLLPLFAILLIFITKDYKKNLILSVITTTLIIISYQTQLQLRYIYSTLPLLIILLAYSFQYMALLFNKFKLNKKILLVFLLILLIIPSFNLFIKEHSEINQYEEGSLAIHKKLEFREIMDFLKKVDITNQKYLLIADHQSALTLDVYGFKVDYIILPKNDYRMINGGEEKYFGIPYLEYSSIEFKNLNGKEDMIFVTRQFWEFPYKQNYFDFKEDFNRPEVYSNFLI